MRKLQIVQLNAEDQGDCYALLKGCPVDDGDHQEPRLEDEITHRRTPPLVRGTRRGGQVRRVAAPRRLTPARSWVGYSGVDRSEWDQAPEVEDGLPVACDVIGEYLLPILEVMPSSGWRGGFRWVGGRPGSSR